ARSASPPGSVHESLEKALGILSRTKDLTHQLLTFAKGGAPTKKTGMLHSLLPEWTLFALSGSKVTARFEIADDLRPVDFDQNQIGQVFNNIVLNAQQAMPMGGEILVSAANIVLSPGSLPALKAGNYVRISVRDSGPGIPANILPYIFDPFFSTKQSGSGLGLATAYSIVKKHEGEITVESTDGTGATFHVLLPDSEKTVSPEAVAEHTGHRGAGRILVMDDNDSIRDILSRMLEMMGYTVESCADGKEALGLIRAAAGQGRPFSLVFMDLTIPGGMGGREAVAELRKEDRTTRVIVTSGYFSDPIMANPAAFGFDDRFQKPFSLEDLNRLMERLMGPVKTGTCR
ncbi:response regulator, partial [Candidatus Ozemobacteraceae bacterium]|nr:response regulator [Candidatus Ozemobacteraceae bacterium]